MTSRLRNLILMLCALFTSSIIEASCPVNYTTSSITVTDGGGNPVLFDICYPSVVSLSVNSGQFNIYVTITNTGITTSDGIAFRGFLPDLAGD